MDIWSEYQAGGLWGLWTQYFPAGFSLGVRGGGTACLFTPKQLRVDSWETGGAEASFYWQAESGFELAIFAEALAGPEIQAAWIALLELEARTVDPAPTFLPFLPPVGELSEDLNKLIFEPPPVVILNGQPGTGKGAVLQCLALLHANSLVAIKDGPVAKIKTPGGDIFFIPEVAMLEVDVQQILAKQAKAGARIWGATAYDMAMLKNRKILSGSLVELFEAAKHMLPPVSRRDPEELKKLALFWQALHGVEKKRFVANLDFLKRRALGQDSLSVETILEEGRGLRGVIAEFEKEAILKAYSRVGRSQHKVARLLKVSRGSLQHKLRKYQLESYASPDADTEDSE